MDNNKKYKIDFSMGCANYYYYTKKDKELVSRFKIFTDIKGLKIFTRNGVEYLTESNSEVVKWTIRRARDVKREQSQNNVKKTANFGKNM